MRSSEPGRPMVTSDLVVIKEAQHDGRETPGSYRSTNAHTHTAIADPA